MVSDQRYCFRIVMAEASNNDSSESRRDSAAIRFADDPEESQVDAAYADAPFS